MSVEIRGAEQFGKLARDLRAAGEKDLQKELTKAVNKAVRPVMKAARASAKATLPQRGGLAARVAASRMSTRRYSSSKQEGVRLIAKNAYSLRQLDRGRLRHPVFGNPNVWVDQPVTPGWWTQPAEAAGPVARAEIEKAVQAIADKLSR